MSLIAYNSPECDLAKTKESPLHPQDADHSAESEKSGLEYYPPTPPRCVAVIFMYPYHILCPPTNSRWRAFPWELLTLKGKLVIYKVGYLWQDTIAGSFFHWTFWRGYSTFLYPFSSSTSWMQLLYLVFHWHAQIHLEIGCLLTLNLQKHSERNQLSGS